MDPAEIPLSDYLCLSLQIAGRAVDGMYRRLLADVDLTYPQYVVMRMLWQRGPLLVKEIGSVLDVDYGTLSPLLQRLEGAGLVTRTRQKDDERAVEVALTPTGVALERKAGHIPGEVLAGFGLTQSEGETLRLLLDTVTNSAKLSSQGSKG
jgi:MarR family transcriptional regulator, organic hydroperoxide resistance regulator